jgi:hypothetical protein
MKRTYLGLSVKGFIMDNLILKRAAKMSIGNDYVSLLEHRPFLSLG